MGNRYSTLTTKIKAKIFRAANREIPSQELSPPVNTKLARSSPYERPRVNSVPQKLQTGEDLPRSRTKSAPQKVRPMKAGKGLPPLPPQKPRENAASQKVQVIKDSPPSLAYRFRARSAPQKVQSIKGGDESPPLPSQRSRSKSSVAQSSRGPNADIKLLSAGGRDRSIPL